MPGNSADFARLVSLACHDMRTPLATVGGFARTLERTAGLADPVPRYLEIMVAACDQLAEILDEVGLVARIEAGRYEPELREHDTLELARGAAQRLGEERVAVDGPGSGDAARVVVDAEAAERALARLASCAIRHGALERVQLRADGPALRLAPVAPEVGPILLGDELRDLGAAVAVRVVAALGGTAVLEGEGLVVHLPLAPALA